MTDARIVKEWLDKARDDALFAAANLKDETQRYPVHWPTNNTTAGAAANWSTPQLTAVWLFDRSF